MTILRVASWSLAVLFAFGCSSSGAGGGPGDGGTMLGSQGVIGAKCDGTHPCNGGLFCYAGDTLELSGLCTTTCTAGTDSDTCLLKYPNTACLVAGVCGASCGDGLGCPAGSVCDSSYEVCINPSPPAPPCEYQNDGYCDEPELCAPGTDTADCG